MRKISLDTVDNVESTGCGVLCIAIMLKMILSERSPLVEHRLSLLDFGCSTSFGALARKMMKTTTARLLAAGDLDLGTNQRRWRRVSPSTQALQLQ